MSAPCRVCKKQVRHIDEKGRAYGEPVALLDDCCLTCFARFTDWMLARHKAYPSAPSGGAHPIPGRFVEPRASEFIREESK